MLKESTKKSLILGAVFTAGFVFGAGEAINSAIDNKAAYFNPNRIS